MFHVKHSGTGINVPFLVKSARHKPEKRKTKKTTRCVAAAWVNGSDNK
jgi:hypothetical protein